MLLLASGAVAAVVVVVVAAAAAAAAARDFDIAVRTNDSAAMICYYVSSSDFNIPGSVLMRIAPAVFLRRGRSSPLASPQAQSPACMEACCSGGHVLRTCIHLGMSSSQDLLGLLPETGR